MYEKPVFFHGSGVVSALGDSAVDVCRNLGADVQNHASMRFAMNRIADDFHCDLLTEREGKRQTKISQLVLESTRRCLSNSGIDLATFDYERTGMVSGSIFGSLTAMDETFRAYHFSGGRKGLNPVEFSKATYNFPISSTMLHYGMKGPSVAMVSHSSVAMDAIANAVMYLQEGMADTMIVVLYEDLNELAETLLANSIDDDCYVQSCVSMFFSRDRPTTVSQSKCIEVTATELFGRAEGRSEVADSPDLFLNAGGACKAGYTSKESYLNLSPWMGNHLSVSPALALSMLANSELFRNAVLSNISAQTEICKIAIGAGEYGLNRAEIRLELAV